METDESLHLRMKSGELSAFDELYERHRKPLFGFILRYLQSREEAEEIFHEAFMSLLEEKQLDFSQGSLRGWLHLNARNRALNRLRSRGRAVRHLRVEPLEPEPTDAETLLIEHGVEEALKKALERLPPELAELLRLKLSGAPNREIARLLSVPEGTVKSRFNTLARRLREEVGMNGVENGS